MTYREKKQKKATNQKITIGLTEVKRCYVILATRQGQPFLPVAYGPFNADRACEWLVKHQREYDFQTTKLEMIPIESEDTFTIL